MPKVRDPLLRQDGYATYADPVWQCDEPGNRVDDDRGAAETAAARRFSIPATTTRQDLTIFGNEMGKNGPGSNLASGERLPLPAAAILASRGTKVSSAPRALHKFQVLCE